VVHKSPMLKILYKLCAPELVTCNTNLLFEAREEDDRRIRHLQDLMKTSSKGSSDFGVQLCSIIAEKLAVGTDHIICM
jgi:hypothetical protein